MAAEAARTGQPGAGAVAVTLPGVNSAWKDGAGALREVAAELRDLGRLKWGLQPLELAQLMSVPKGKIVPRFIEVANALMNINALLFMAVVIVFFDLPDLVLAKLASALHAPAGSMATAFVFSVGVLVVALGCNTTLTSWSVIHASAIDDDRILPWLSRARFTTYDKYNLVYVNCFLLLTAMVCLYGYLLFEDAGMPATGKGFAAAMAVLAGGILASIMRVLAHINPLSWLGYSVFTYFFWPFAGRTPMNKELVASAEEYARLLAEDMEATARRMDAHEGHARARAEAAAAAAAEGRPPPAEGRRRGEGGEGLDDGGESFASSSGGEWESDGGGGGEGSPGDTREMWFWGRLTKKFSRSVGRSMRRLGRSLNRTIGRSRAHRAESGVGGGGGEEGSSRPGRSAASRKMKRAAIAAGAAVKFAAGTATGGDTTEER